MKVIVNWNLELRGKKEDIKDKVEEICKILDGSEVELLYFELFVDEEEVELEKFLDS